MEISVAHSAPNTVIMVNAIMLMVTVNVPVPLTDMEDPNVISLVLITVLLKGVIRT